MSRTAARILDDYLVASSRAGDRGAFARLTRCWHPRLVAHAWRLTGSRADADDAVQAGWIEIAAGLRNLREERAFAAWAYRIISRRCARTISAAVRQRALGDALAGEITAEAPDPGAGLDGERLRAAVRDLPPDQRAAVALFYFEELSIAEVAVALDVPTGTIKTRLMHARRKLRAHLEGAG